MGEGGFEPPKPKQQIYSLPHLTALELSLFSNDKLKAYLCKLQMIYLQNKELVDGLEPPTC